jgi:putative Holliday junction resolvase
MSGPDPHRGRVLAIDFGSVRWGLAISDPDQRIASPLANYTRVSPARDAEFLQRVVREEQVTQIVVGLPVHLDGGESRKSQEARRFADWLRQAIGVPVVLFDERFTTVEAEQELLAAQLSRRKRKRRLDMVAAQRLLAVYLETDPTVRGQSPMGLTD